MAEFSVSHIPTGHDCDAESNGIVDGRDTLIGLIEHAAHLLPSQGPITVFVHHNTLHAYEGLPFNSGVKAGGKRYGCHAYLPEEQYREQLRRGRIRVSDLEAVLIDDLGEDADRLIATFGTRYALRLAMLQFPLRTGADAELRWVIAETDALRKFREEISPVIRERMIASTSQWTKRAVNGGESNGKPATAKVLDAVFEQFDKRSVESWPEETWESFCLNFLWRVCRQGVQLMTESQTPSRTAPSLSRRHRDLLVEATGEDADIRVNEILIRFCSAFLDQGFADWELPNRDEGFYRSFLALYQSSRSAPTRWLKAIQREAQRLSDAGIGSLDSILESLNLLGIEESEREEFLTQSLLTLRGWAGMIWQMETNAEWTPRPAPAGSLSEFLAVRLILDRLSVQQIAGDVFGRDIKLDRVREIAAERIPAQEPHDIDQRTFTVFQIAQVLGWKPHHLQQLSAQQWEVLIDEIESFSSLERRRIYHLAYERKYRMEALDAVIAHTRRLHAIKSRRINGKSSSRRAAFQVVCCIDDREESFRRHLEEVDPDCETFGFAGFYGVAMYYRGISDAHFKPLCPVSIKPQHYIVEEPLYSAKQAEQLRAATRRRIGRATHQTHRGTRTFLGGLITGLFGSFAAFPLVARVMFPRTTARLMRWVSDIVQTPNTELRLERTGSPQTANKPERLDGYTVSEMAGIVDVVLRSTGMIGRFSRLIVFLGHGSMSLNNPHESAYNCGACSGSQGGPNARAFARMANDFRVRNLLKDRGITIPDDSVFVGGYHDTTNDSVTFADLDLIPVTHRPDFERALAVINEVRASNAHERCRRFESADFGLTFDEALRHVEARPEDLSQARPEYNHATNALCFVGRREWSRGLFLDRRAFLASYDPRMDDPQGTVLEGILRPAIPVCAGISLEYFFSTVDQEGYGCGSKLPHNITSLLGVMTGAASDLRPGLSTQMTEIHEPMRILFVIESTPEAMRRIIENNVGIKRLVNGDWVQLAVFDAETVQVHRYVRSEFVPYQPEAADLPVVPTSAAWYGRKRDHLGFASIDDSNQESKAVTQT